MVKTTCGTCGKVYDTPEPITDPTDPFAYCSDQCARDAQAKDKAFSDAIATLRSVKATKEARVTLWRSEALALLAYVEEWETVTAKIRELAKSGQLATAPFPVSAKPG